MPSNFKVLSGASGEPNDPNFKNVTLLLHGDGSNGAQNNTFIDSSTNNFTITRNGNTTQGSFSPYGSNWSNYFDGSGDYLEVADNAAFDFGTGDFTIEFWMFAQNLASTPMFFHKGTNSAGWFCQTTASTFYFGQLDSNRYTTWSVSLSDNAWYHIALTRVGSSLNVFINGVSQTAKTVSGADASNDNANNVVIGRIASGGYQFQGYLSNYRIVKGTAVYTTNFTPSTTPLTAITNTSLLTCQSNRFRDGSTNNFTITRNGDVKVTNFAPFAPSSAYSTSTNGGSAYFDGSGDWLTISQQTALSFGTGDFIIEAWVYPSSYVGFYTVIDARDSTSGSGNQPWVFGLRNTSSIYYVELFLSDTVKYTGSIAVPLNAWTHICISRVSGTLKSFVNGVVDYNASMTSNVNANGTTQQIGRTYDPTYDQGYLTDIRVVKGSGVTSVTVPTAPLSAITNTQFLLRAQNAAIFDNSMKNDLETVGNAQISTSVKKFGTGSIYLDGDDSLVLPANPALALDGGAFTIEAWVYPTTLSGTKPIIECRTSGSSSAGYAFLVNSSGNLNVYTAGSFLGASSTALSANTWTHVALVRTGTGGNQTTYYINGTASGSITMSGNFTDAYTTITRIGASTTAGEFWPGYIDELRVTKGVARYTSSFTPPTAAFPNK